MSTPYAAYTSRSPYSQHNSTQYTARATINSFAVIHNQLTSSLISFNRGVFCSLHKYTTFFAVASLFPADLSTSTKPVWSTKRQSSFSLPLLPYTAVIGCPRVFLELITQLITLLYTAVVVTQLFTLRYSTQHERTLTQHSTVQHYQLELLKMPLSSTEISYRSLLLLMICQA